MLVRLNIVPNHARNLGAFVGSKVLSDEKEYKWIGKIQFVAIIILVLAIGIRIGSDDRVISSLGDRNLLANSHSVCYSGEYLWCLYCQEINESQ